MIVFSQLLLIPQIDPKRKRVDMRGGEVKFIGDVTKIRILVTPVNDKPVVKRVRADLEPVPYDLNVSSYSGTLVKDVFDQSKADALVEDIDDRNMYLGVAVLAAENGTLGQWQYQMNDSMAFTDFSFTKDAEIMLLPPEATYVRSSDYKLQHVLFYKTLILNIIFTCFAFGEYSTEF